MSDSSTKATLLPLTPYYRDTQHVPSKPDTAVVGSLSSGPKYTGNQVLGIIKMHNSNYVPVTTPEQAREVTNMRRSRS